MDRVDSSPAFAAASNHLDIWLGAINTAVPICSSFTMAMAVYSAETDRPKPLVRYLILTIVLGLVFLGIKLSNITRSSKSIWCPAPRSSSPNPWRSPRRSFFP